MKFPGHKRILLLAGLLIGLVAGASLPSLLQSLRVHAQEKPIAGPVDAAAIEAELTAVKGLLPDQSHAMADVAYHFANLWFAAQKKNWSLAKFYLDETRSHLNWAVRIRPIRKNNAGQEIDLKGILQSVDNTLLTEVQKAIDQKDNERFANAYRQTLEGCYSCHKTSDKSWLRPQIPDVPAAQIINFDPNATWP